jgi:hypothetical protein
VKTHIKRSQRPPNRLLLEVTKPASCFQVMPVKANFCIDLIPDMEYTGFTQPLLKFQICSLLNRTAQFLHFK